MHWYKVVKEVRGNRYLYLQHSYRVGGRKNPSTLNIYCGRADDGASWRRADARKESGAGDGWATICYHDFAAFAAEFAPVKNIARPDGPFGGCLYGADAEGREHVERVAREDTGQVWTLLWENDRETLVDGLREGRAVVGYFISRKRALPGRRYATPIEYAHKTPSEPALAVDERAFVDELLDMSKPFAKHGTVDARWDLRPTKAAAWAHTEAYEIAPRMGVTVKTQITKGRSNGAPVYNWLADSISVPDLTRYRAGLGLSAQEHHTMAMLHETVHATMKRLRRERPRTRGAYVREELVAEIGAWVVARRLGITPQSHDAARWYLQHYWGYVADRDATRVWVEREVAKAADFIVAHHTQGGWRNPGTDTCVTT